MFGPQNTPNITATKALNNGKQIYLSFLNYVLNRILILISVNKYIQTNGGKVASLIYPYNNADHKCELELGCSTKA